MNRNRDCSDLRKNYDELKEKVDVLRDLYGPLEDSIFSKETGRILSNMMGSIISSKSSINDDIEKINRDKYLENRDLLIEYIELMDNYPLFKNREMEKGFGYMGMNLEPFSDYVNNISIELRRLN